MSMILIMRALARAAHNQEKRCISGYICGNRGQGGFEPKQYQEGNSFKTSNGV